MENIKTTTNVKFLQEYRAKEEIHKTTLAISTKIKHTPVLWHGHSTTTFISNRNEYICPPNGTLKNACSFSHNNQNYSN
jgi:hypothetical protein